MVIVIAATVLATTGMICLTALRAWHGWLELKRLELAATQRTGEGGGEDNVGVRIELAAVRERLKKLEAIASGVDI